MTKRISHLAGCIASVLKQKMKLLIVAAALLTGGLQAQTTVTINYGDEGQTSGAGTWTVPAGVTSIDVQCWGGGGAGGSAKITAAGTNIIRAGAGAGGSYAGSTIPVTPGEAITYTVGAGGTALASGSMPDNTWTRSESGSSTTFGAATIVAVGGQGGEGVQKNTSAYAAGSTAATTGNTGTVIYYGGNGLRGYINNSMGSGGGGGSAGATGPGGNATGTAGAAGAAGTGGGAAGGAGTNPVLPVIGYDGAAGNVPGAGGAGAAANNYAGATLPIYYAGGKGGDGRIIITYTGGTSTGLSTTKANTFVTVIGNNLILNGDVNAVEVYNALGKLMQSQGNVSSVNNLNNGIYIVRMHTPQGVNVQKVSIR